MIISYYTLSSIWICFFINTFNDGKSLLFHMIFVPLRLTSEFRWNFYMFYCYFNSYSLFWIFLIPLIPFNLSLSFRMFIHWSTNFMETYFEALGSIPILDVSFLANLPIIFVFFFKQRLPVALSPSTTLLPWTGALIARYIIISYEDDNKFIKYITKAHLYFMVQPSVSYHTVDIPHTNISESNYVFNIWIIWACESHSSSSFSSLIYELNRIFSLLPGSIKFGKYSTAILSVHKFLFPSKCWLFIYIPFFCWVLLHNISLTLYIYIYWCIIMEIMIYGLPILHWTKNPDMSNMKW